MKVLHFTSKSCGSCQMVKPVIDELGENIDVEVLDVNQNQNIADSYNVMKLPTTVFINSDDEVVETFNGVRRKDDYMKYVN